MNLEARVTAVSLIIAVLCLLIAVGTVVVARHCYRKWGGAVTGKAYAEEKLNRQVLATENVRKEAETWKRAYEAEAAKATVDGEQS